MLLKIFSFFLLFVPVLSFSQIGKLDIKSQRLRLQLGAGYLNVATQNQVDLDSGLLLASSRNHLTRMAVIGENYEDIISNPANTWVATENIGEVKRQALIAEGRKRIQFLNLVGAYYAFQPMTRKKDLDSAMKYLQLAKQGSETQGDEKNLCQTLIYLAKCYLKIGGVDTAGKIFMQAINLAVKSEYKSEQAMALMYWGSYSPFRPNTISERIDHLKSALSIYELIGNREGQILALTNLSYLNFAVGKVPESRKYFEHALSIERVIGFPFTFFTTDLLCLISIISNEPESRLKYAMDAVRAAESSRDSTALAYIYARRGSTELGSTERDSKQTLDWYFKSLDEFIRTGDRNMYGTVENITGILERTGKTEDAIHLLRKLLKDYPPSIPLSKFQAFVDLAEAYESINNLNEAEKYYLLAEDMQKEMISFRGNVDLNRFYAKIGGLYFKLRQYEKSRSYFEKSRTFLGQFSTSYGLLSNTEKSLALIDSAEGKFEDAYKHSAAAERSLDSFYRKQDINKVGELRVQYETEKKDNNIKILNQQAALQKAEIRQDKLTRTGMIAGAAILLLFLGLLYNRYRLKQKQEKEISQKNISLQHLVEEKEFLMKEIHHRVKNNLQIVISLLNTQSKFLNNEEAIAAISESRHRMQAMSLIHQKLYQSENVAFVAMPGYIRELVDYLDLSFNTRQKITFELDIDPIDLDISQAIPVGLILNEAVTNCIKHAFADQPNGTIGISMNALPDGMIALEIIDNGKGLPADFDFTTSQSMGIRLIRGLIEQIGGELNFSDKGGCRIATTFKQDLVLRAVVV
jgi:two-component system, sensor histidine kinase PdtaS